ncbi:MAG: hypothetical protein HY056_10410, partial [Proteobacteria bacterium]|nr:hypothetical protein [Pseudomonadota bacterium]
MPCECRILRLPLVKSGARYCHCPEGSWGLNRRTPFARALLASVAIAAAFSLAASSFFPALVIGVFWKRANKWGAISGMVAGLGICMYYMVKT